MSTMRRTKTKVRDIVLVNHFRLSKSLINVNICGILLVVRFSANQNEFNYRHAILGSGLPCHSKQIAVESGILVSVITFDIDKLIGCKKIMWPGFHYRRRHRCKHK